MLYPLCMNKLPTIFLSKKFHRTERNLGSKRERIINVVEVLASPCILTLILSFVLSCYLINIRDCKLKTCIINCGGISLSEITSQFISLTTRKIINDFPQLNHTRTR
jgi:hypothetical protein